MEIAVAAGFLLLGALAGAAACWRTGVARNLRAACGLQGENTRLQATIADLQATAAAAAKAEAASEAKSRFLAMISHEIRTPLNGVLGIAELLAGTRLDREQQNYVDAIRTSGHALSSLIDEILDLSRIESGRLDLVDEAFDLVTLIESAAELLAPRAQDKGVEIATSASPELPPSLMGDPARIRQIVLNLAGNAIKFTERGGVAIRACLAGASVRIEVIDTGPGVPAALRDSIFEDFTRGEPPSPNARGGSGLGLSISRRLAERMGGTLRLVETGAQGSTFAFEFPLRAGDIPAVENATALAGRRALIVCRSAFEGPFLGERLAALGAHAEVVECAERVIDRLNAGETPDIVIVDCAVGGDAAARVADAARAAGAARSLVLFSPFERRTLPPATLGHFDGWLVKPVRASTLVARLAESAAAADGQGIERAPERAPGDEPVEILLAEDNEINALASRKRLETLGARVTRACNGEEAVSLMAQAIDGRRPGFRLVLMDLRMPLRDGLQAARAIRELEAAKGVPPVRIVALTANAFEDDRSACRAAGMDEILTKPLGRDALASILEPARERPGRLTVQRYGGQLVRT